MTNRAISPIADRFWAKVKIAGEDQCWEWTATRHKRGYGCFRIRQCSARDANEPLDLLFSLE
jgi:hypothetical protein